MELKTRDGKYFSELGKWSDIVRIFALLVVFKIFGLLAGIISVVFLWGVPILWKKHQEAISAKNDKMG